MSSDSLNTASCLAAVFHGSREPLQIQPIERPIPAHREALVQIELCTICGSDLHTCTGARVEPTPSILGHEIVGVVTELGDPPLCDIDGLPLQLGDRVTWSVCISCGTCDRCLAGMTQKCRRLSKYGHDLATGRTALNGGLAEAILLQSGSTVVRVDSAIPAEVICPANCATATIAAAYRVAGELSGKRVLIFGAGMLGLTAAAFAASAEASLIVVCDVNQDRLQQATQFGATATVAWTNDPIEMQRQLHDLCGTDSFDVILELSGSPDAVEATCQFADIAANVVLVGTVMKSRGVQFDPEMIVRRWISIHGVHNYAPCDLQTAVNFLQQNHSRFPFATLVEQTYQLAEINDAISKAIQDRPVRVAIRP